MDFIDSFQAQFRESVEHYEADVDLGKKLQETRHALQESISENDQLMQIINQLYSESRIENVATSELISQITSPLYRNVPLPKNGDSLILSEKAGYILYYLKFLGFTARKVTEEYHKATDRLEVLHKSVKSNTASVIVNRTGSLKVPELDGDKELKRGHKTTAPATPPITPPQHQTRKIKESK